MSGQKHDDSPGSTVMSGGLYVIATPIGNLGDMTYRAIETLKSADIVACEDSRVTGKLLNHFGIKARLQPYHEHNGAVVRPKLLRKLSEGARIALVSDAGTPCLADPGYKLVSDAAKLGIPVMSVPGPSSLTAALSIAGLPTDRHYFEGFLSSKAGERMRRLAQLAQLDATLILLESPHRIVATLTDIQEIFGDRQAALARELTKRHEEVLRGPISEIRSILGERDLIKGEIVLLIARSSDEPELSDAAIDGLLRTALAEDKPSKAAARIAQKTGRPRDELYKRAMMLKSS